MRGLALLALCGWGPCGSPSPPSVPDAAIPGCPANSQSDPHNCGSCGLDCGGGSCSFGLCSAVTFEPGGVRRTALHSYGDYLYWIDQSSFSIMRRQKSAGTAEVVVTDPVLADTTDNVGLHLDGNDLYYWADQIYLHDPVFGHVSFGGPAQDATTGNGELAWIVNGASVLESRSLEGGALATADTAPFPYALVSDDAARYWTTEGPVMDTPMGTVHVGGAIWRQPYGGAATQLVSLDSGLDLTEDATSLYFVSGSYAASRSVSSIPKTGGAAITYGSGMLLQHPVVDAQFVYWLAYDANYMPSTTAIFRADKLGGGAEPIAGDQTLSDLAVDDTDLYWIVAATGEIRRMTKPTPAPVLEPAPPATCDEASCGTGQYCLLAGGCDACDPSDQDHCGDGATAAGCVRCPIGRYCDSGACASCSLTDPLECGDAQSVRGCQTCPGTNPTCAGGVCGDYTWTSSVVTDLQTGLKWERVPSTASFGFGSDTSCGFQSADARCAGLTLDGLTGWRVPTESELLTLVRPASCGGCATIDTTAFPGAAAVDDWTSTQRPICPTCPTIGMFYVDFHGGFSSYAASPCSVTVPGPSLGVRCVH